MLACRIALAWLLLATVPAEAASRSVGCDSKSAALFGKAGFRLCNVDGPKVAQEFLSLIRGRNLEGIKSFLGGQFFEEDRLEEGAYELVFGDGPYTVEKIARNDLFITVVPQGSDSFVALFTLAGEKKRALDTKFIENQWMRKFFACRFVRAPEAAKASLGFQLDGNFCFAETGGPFHSY